MVDAEEHPAGWVGSALRHRMTRSSSPLSQHLLTRSDLARLGIRSGSILAWLADDWLDQVGSLPGDLDGDPVFAVLNRELRSDLATRLAAIGKDTVVLTPARVRSVLLRAMMSASAAGPSAAAATSPVDPIESMHAACEAANDSVPEALAVTAALLEHEVDALVEMTRQEAQLEAREVAESAPEPGEDADGDGEEPADEADFFDAEDLAGELDSWGPEEVPAPMRSDPSTGDAVTETSRADAQDAAAVLTCVDQAASVVVASTPPCEPPTCSTPEPAAWPTAALENTMQEPTTEDLFATPDAAPAVAPSTPESAFESTAAGTPKPPPEALFAEAPAPAQVLAEPLASDRDADLPTALPAPATASAADTPAEAVTPNEPAETTAVQTMTRVESFLGELRHALVELANRPQSQPVDMQPLVAAVQSGFAHSTADATATNSSIASLAEQLGDFGKRVEVGVALAVRTALDRETKSAAASASPVPFIVARTERSTIALFGIGFLLLCWTAIFWFKTGSPRLALGTLVGANLIGCCLLAGRRRSS